MRISEHKSNKEMARIVFSRFQNGDTKDGIKYSLGGLYVYKYVKLVSKDALQLIKKNNPEALVTGKGIDYTKLRVTKAMVMREHIIPVASLYQHLADKGEKLTEGYILKIMPLLEIALITKEQNKKLKQAGLNSKMLEGWWTSKERNPLDRYRYAGLLDEIWAKEFVEFDNSRRLAFGG